MARSSDFISFSLFFSRIAAMLSPLSGMKRGTFFSLSSLDSASERFRWECALPERNRPFSPPFFLFFFLVRGRRSLSFFSLDGDAIGDGDPLFLFNKVPPQVVGDELSGMRPLQKFF